MIWKLILKSLMVTVWCLVFSCIATPVLIRHVISFPNVMFCNFDFQQQYFVMSFSVLKSHPAAKQQTSFILLSYEWKTYINLNFKNVVSILWIRSVFESSLILRYRPGHNVAWKGKIISLLTFKFALKLIQILHKYSCSQYYKNIFSKSFILLTSKI